MRSIELVLSVTILLVGGCGSVQNDLLPSGADKRQPAQQGITGHSVGQQAPDFTVSDTLGNTVSLSSSLSHHRGIVIYFTMWCPVCDAHMSSLRDSVIPNNPDILFFAVDYVSGTVSEARNAELSNGYGGSGFMVLADTSQMVLGLYNGTMGTTVVIDRGGTVRMNEDYKNGTRLQSVLSELP
jgi:thiol-disulfide isomerase/thioredoxin